VLQWLDPDRENAGRIYERIRRKLIKLFTCRGCRNPEELADETIDRVAGKIDEIVDSYHGDPTLYFYGVAKNVCREFAKGKYNFSPPPSPDQDSVQPELDCLDECLEHLLPKNRDLLLGYYEEEKLSRIRNRKLLAERHGLDLNALRIRVHRLRSAIGACTMACVQRRNGTAQMSPQITPPRNTSLRFPIIHQL
jgi:DNA-directed RNA polymerase specialized sigma24 family protein